MDTLLKEMLLSLHNSLDADIITLTRQFSREVNSLGDRVHNIEKSMGDMTTISKLVDAHDESVEECTCFKSKPADLEDCFGRKNLKLRGIPESVQ